MDPSQRWPVLAPDQQRLLLAALRSNRKGSDQANIQSALVSNDVAENTTKNPSLASLDLPNGVINPSMLDTSVNGPTSTGFPQYTFADQDFSDVLDSTVNDTSFDFLNDSLDHPSEPSNEDGLEDGGETGEKRKSPGDSEEHGDNKRQEGDDRSSKKPGRKPLNTEPTTKRKAQNRAAQRAFRERKEKHLKDLEQKVVDLEKSSESANHENGLLRAQVQRLQDELSQYRKRVSLQSNSSTPPRTSSATESGTTPNSAFNFDFPKFGSLQQALWPGGKNSPGQSPNNSSTYGSRPSMSPHTSAQSQSQSPVDYSNSLSMNGFTGAYGEYANGKQSTAAKQPSDTWASVTSQQSQQSSAWNVSRSGSHSNTSVASPNSSLGQKGATSSCCTSPESSTDSPKLQKDPSSGQESFGNGFIDSAGQTGKNGAANGNTMADFGFDWLATQNGGQFDPVLFGDYRESQDAVVGDGEFTNGLFEDSFNLNDFDDPFNLGQFVNKTPQPAAQSSKPSLMDQVAAQREGREIDLPSAEPCQSEKKESSAHMMTAHKIWKQIQDCPKFSSGDLDIDLLCSELSTKAKCTETGMAIPKEHVEAALWRLAGEPNEARTSSS